MRRDDHSLSRQERELVESSARRLLERAGAVGMVPVPIDELLKTANLQVAPISIFDPRAIAAYAIEKGKNAASLVKRAVGKILGILDASENVIHFDDSVSDGKQRFVKLHEAGHFELPHQRKIFRFFEDSQQELEPSVADKFEREANNFARYVLFNGGEFANRSADLPVRFGTAKKMQRQFKASLYASLREYTRTHRHVCIAMAIEKPKLCPVNGYSAEIRRAETSLAFEQKFGIPHLPTITKSHPFWPLVPFGRVVKPTEVLLHDLNGERVRFIGEALDTSYNILIFACPAELFDQ